MAESKRKRLDRLAETRGQRLVRLALLRKATDKPPKETEESESKVQRWLEMCYEDKKGKLNRACGKSNKECHEDCDYIPNSDSESISEVYPALKTCILKQSLVHGRSLESAEGTQSHVVTRPTEGTQSHVTQLAEGAQSHVLTQPVEGTQSHVLTQPAEETQSHILTQVLETTDVPDSQNAEKYRKPKRPCVFCEKLFSNLTLHLKRAHKNEPEVQRAMEMDDKGKTGCFDKLRKRGILNVNKKLKAS
ncbi:hypothetical protein ElyMa_005674000 [Elysia marginata]|uniref:C2H2-type domain-containing protein n=1 Tax=Elysia marginata TaxID=1093978 RepID=A0AAV4FD96_9GAST|nr:hypothetical protein ElyMa_005674000 [Elysia marginata]